MTPHETHPLGGRPGACLADGETHADDATQASPQTPVAIVGMACRFAGGATSPVRLWDLCLGGRDHWSRIPKGRFDANSLYGSDSQRPGRHHATGGYFLEEDVARFDASFFNMTADDASAMDPQIRLLLEVVYEATEDAGIPVESLSGSNTSVFAGCHGAEYHDMQTRDPESMPVSFLMGSSTAMMSNRISYFFNLHGASMSIDSACSSGLTCLHQACQTIRSGESRLSIVGASSTMLSPDMFVAMSTLDGMLGADGRCYAWDERAQGCGRGEGVAALVLKALDAALRDGDRIHAIIRDTGVNQNGSTKSIITPSVDAQVSLIRDCYKRAGLDPAETGYVEAHMTGVQADDLAEAQALALTFGASRRPEDDPVLVGSVKTNIGHTGAVSGLAAIFKTVYVLKHQRIPRNLNYETGNPHIKFQNWRLQVPTSAVSWPGNKPLRASINNSGYGGTNAHAILESPLTGLPVHVNPKEGGQTVTPKGSRSRLFVLSAKDPRAARAMARNLALHLSQSIQSGREVPLDDLAYTLAERRSRHPISHVLRSSSLPELIERLEDPGLKLFEALPGKKPRVGLVFTGQGAQWHAMGRELLAGYPVFGAAVHEADEVLRGYGAPWSLKDELLKNTASTRVSEIHLAQPITVALQLCLVRLLRSWEVHPTAVVSHSSGEIAAAYSAGILSFSQALGIVFYQGEISGRYSELKPQEEGGMLAAGVGPREAEKYIENAAAGGRVVVACINSPKSVTLAGDVTYLDRVAARLKGEGVFARRLKVPEAYHSHHMLPMAADYSQRLHQLLPATPNWPGDVLFASPVTGTVVDSPAELGPEHWVRNLTQPVQFSDAVLAIIDHVDVMVEVGPHGTLASPIRQILESRPKMAYVSCLKRGADAIETMQNVAAELLGLGYPLPLKNVNLAASQSPQVFLEDLPTYPWVHTTSYWAESRISRDIRYNPFPPHELLGSSVNRSLPWVTEWRNFLRLTDLPWLADYRVDSEIVLPGAAYISMAIEARRLLAKRAEAGVSVDGKATFRGYKLRGVEFLNALVIPESDAIDVRLRIAPAGPDGWSQFNVFSAGPGSVWTENCRGQISTTTHIWQTQNLETGSFLDAKSPGRDFDPRQLLSRAHSMGIDYGPAFQNLQGGRAVGARAVADLRISNADSYLVHPTTLDCLMQATHACLPEGASRAARFLPKSVESIVVPETLPRGAGERLRIFTELQASSRAGFTSTVSVVNAETTEDGEPSQPLCIEGLFCQAMPCAASLNPTHETTRARSVWLPDILHHVPAGFKDSMRIRLTGQKVGFAKKMERAAYYYIHDAVSQLAKEYDYGCRSQYHRSLYHWMVATVARGQRGELGPGSVMWANAGRGIRQALFDELARGDVSARLMARVGGQLARIVRGEAEPLELMMEGDLLDSYYTETPRLKERSYRQLARLVDEFAVRNPGAAVLEIGTGAGAATKVVLEAFASRATPGSAGTLLGRYTFADISSKIFEPARQKLTAWRSLLDFEKLDIEMDPIGQSPVFVEGSFDLVIASMALHAARNVEKALRNVRRLLKPSGKLFLIENTKDKLYIQLIFGTLPEWWLSEEPSRNMSPNLSVATWDAVLRRTGFTGVEFDIWDCEEPEAQCTSVILSSAVPSAPALPRVASIIYADHVPEPWHSQLSQAFQERTGTALKAELWNQAQLGETRFRIFTGDMADPFLAGMDQFHFQRLRDLLITSRGILWLGCGGLVESSDPKYAMTDGLLRSLRQDTDRRYAHLDFERSAGSPWTNDKIDHIVHVFRHTMDDSTSPQEIDWEFAVQGSVLHVPRIFPSVEVPPTVELRPFYQQRQMLQWDEQGSAMTDISEAAGGAVPVDTVEIEPRAFSIEAFQPVDEHTQAHYYNIAGIVTQVGKEAAAQGLHPGDRVTGLCKAPFASPARAAWTSVVAIPPGMSYANAAGVTVSWATAYHTLVEIGRLRRGESVLIHPAAGVVGLAAVVVAQSAGARVFATYITEANRGVLSRQLGIPDQQLISAHGVGLVRLLKAETQGRGVDLALETSTQQDVEDSPPACLARLGRIVRIVRHPSSDQYQFEQRVLERTVTTTSVDIVEVAEFSPGPFRDAMIAGLQVVGGNNSNAFTSSDAVQYPVARLDEVVSQKFQTDETGGAKAVVVVTEPDAVVKIRRFPRPLALDDPDASYLVVGGLGGIGRAVATWMMAQGARNLLISSRNAADSTDALVLCETARRYGCNLQVRNCDVSSEPEVIRLLQYAENSMPPVRGLIDAAMIFDDSVMEHMTFEQWQRAAGSKVAGTANLDRHLPQGLRFFITISSLAGIAGHQSQANYAVGNAFQNALARARTAKGQAAASMNLGAVRGMGHVADAEGEDSNATGWVELFGTTAVPVEAVLDLVESAIRSPAKDPCDAHVIVGLQPWHSLDATANVRQDRRFGTMRLWSSSSSNDDAQAGHNASAAVAELDPSVMLTEAMGQTDEKTRAGMVSRAVAARLSAIFGTDASAVNLSEPLANYGVDSVVAVELRNWISTVGRVKISIFEILHAASVFALSETILSPKE